METIKITLFLSITLLLFVTYTLTPYAELFKKEKLYKNVDAIIILSGNPKTRSKRAIELFNGKVSDKIYMTETPSTAHKEQKKVLNKIFNLEGVKFDVLPSLNGGATSTFDEARDAVVYAKKMGWNSIIIVTDEFHSARAYYAFSKVFKLLKSKTKIGIATAKNDIFNVNNWWKSDTGISAYVLEALKFIVYIFKSSNLEFIEQE